jgi:hypothetical protein
MHQMQSHLHGDLPEDFGCHFGIDLHVRVGVGEMGGESETQLKLGQDPPGQDAAACRSQAPKSCVRVSVCVHVAVCQIGFDAHLTVMITTKGKHVVGFRL